MIFTKKVLVYENQQALFFKNGKYVRTVGPGRHFFMRGNENIVLFDLRESNVMIGGQEMSTADGASIRLSMVVNCNIVDPLVLHQKLPIDRSFSAITPHVANWPIHHEVQIQTREWIGSRPLQEVLDNRALLAPTIFESVKTVAKGYGIEISSIRLLDFNLVGSLKSAQADVLKAELEGKAAMQRARNEAATLRSLVNSARLTQEHPGLLELRILASGQKPRVTFMVGQPEVAKQVLTEESSE